MLRHQFKPRNKYNATSTIVEDITFGAIKFGSKKEAREYERLSSLKEKGEVLTILRQVPIHLPGGVRYVLDYLVFYSNGTVECREVKGMKTPSYILKKKQVEALYPFKLIEC